MKKRNETIIHMVNWCLLFSVPITLMTVKVDTNNINSFVDTKKLSTSLFSKVEDVSLELPKEEEKVEEEDTEKEIIEEKKEEVTPPKKQQEKKKEEPQQTNETPIKEETIPVATNPTVSYTGRMSFYYANCTGCSGITSTGVDVSDGRIYYQDKEYGQVRIVAAGTEIKKWSIIRIKNSSVGSNVLAIVLDRGGDIGQGRRFLIDMLTNSSENRGGVDKNITVEVVREGK